MLVTQHYYDVSETFKETGTGLPAGLQTKVFLIFHVGLRLRTQMLGVLIWPLHALAGDAPALIEATCT